LNLDIWTISRSQALQPVKDVSKVVMISSELSSALLSLCRSVNLNITSWLHSGGQPSLFFSQKTY